MRIVLAALAFVAALALCVPAAMAFFELRELATMAQPPGNLDDYQMLQLLGGDLLENPVAGPGGRQVDPAEIASRITRRCMIVFGGGIVIGIVGLVVLLSPAKAQGSP